jgi:hypothetical protein
MFVLGGRTVIAIGPAKGQNPAFGLKTDLSAGRVFALLMGRLIVLASTVLAPVRIIVPASTAPAPARAISPGPIVLALSQARALVLNLRSVLVLNLASVLAQIVPMPG